MVKTDHNPAEFKRRYGEAVRKFRLKAGLKTTDIAIDRKELSKLERGARYVTSKDVVALAKAHKMDANDYMNHISETLD